MHPRFWSLLVQTKGPKLGAFACGLPFSNGFSQMRCLAESFADADAGEGGVSEAVEERPRDHNGAPSLFDTFADGFSPVVPRARYEGDFHSRHTVPFARPRVVDVETLVAIKSKAGRKLGSTANSKRLERLLAASSSSDKAAAVAPAVAQRR